MVVVAVALRLQAVAVAEAAQLPQQAAAVAHRRRQLLQQQLQFLLFQHLRLVIRPMPTPQPLQRRPVGAVVDSVAVPEAVPLRQLQAAQPHPEDAGPQHRLLARP